MNARELGEWGEEKAMSFLLDKGYDIIEKNFRCPLGEIDLIAYEKKTLIFVEVKTRRNLKFGVPKLSVHGRKQKKLRDLASYFMMVNDDFEYKRIRFDVISITISDGKGHIKHFKNAF